MEDMIVRNIVNTNTKFFTNADLQLMSKMLCGATRSRIIRIESEETGKVGDRVRRHKFHFSTNSMMRVYYGKLIDVANRFGISTSNLSVNADSTGYYVEVMEYECTILSNQKYTANK